MPATKPSKDASSERARIQMADIARLAGVSTATVSRALGESDLVNEKTRTRIQELAKSLKYQVNVGAKNLRLGQSKTISVVVPFLATQRQTITDPFFIGMLGSLADAVTELGFDLLLSRIDAEHLDAAGALFHSGRAIGVILIGQWKHHDQLNALAAQRVPLVVWGAQLPMQAYCTVGSDNVEGGLLATAHLLAQGRKRVAFFGDRNLPEVAHRYAGYQQAHQQAGVAILKSLVISTPFTADGGRASAQLLVAAKTKFDAIFACSDLIAMTAANTLRSLGIHVPHDVALVGFDDIEMAAHFHPPLSTVHQQIDVAARVLVDSLMRIVGGESIAPTLLPTRLVVRETSG